eukprot:1161934-Pelagomonas_calceolata.AAC.10
MGGSACARARGGSTCAWESEALNSHMPCCLLSTPRSGPTAQAGLCAVRSVPRALTLESWII